MILIFILMKECNLLFLKQQKIIFNKLYNKRFIETNRLINQIDFNDLHYIYEHSSHIIKFDDFVSPLYSHDQIKNECTVEFARCSQKRFGALLKPLKRGNETEEQKRILDNIAKFYDARNDIFDLF